MVRLTPHSSDDDDRRYRPAAEREQARGRDPIVVFGHYLREHGLLDDETETRLRASVKETVEAALEQAEAAPPPAPETAFDHVYNGLRAANFRDR